MKSVAIVHEWFASYAGSERVVEQLLGILPHADVFALCDFLSDEDRRFLGGRAVNTSVLQRLPFARSKFRHFLPFMPLAVEQFDVTGYDAVVSSNHAVAKGVVTSPDQLHVSYVHTPARYAWDLQHQYLRETRFGRGPVSLVLRAALHYLRVWDQCAANRVDVFVANSEYIARRVWRTYRRPAHVIYPPVDVAAFAGDAPPLPTAERDDFYLAFSRLVPYKRVDVIVDAFAATPGRQLVVIGDGTERAKLEARAAAAGATNVRFLGYQSFEAVRDHMRRARAFVFAAEEDFGIAPVEAMACGTPVIAYGRGGARESVVEGETGLLFDAQDPAAVADAVDRFEADEARFEPAAIRARAHRFRPERFRAEMAELLAEQWDLFQSGRVTRPDRDRDHRAGPSRPLSPSAPVLAGAAAE
ncbi:MAG: glycosyltransferase family 4 protein [Phycisphaerales bacterium]|nr:glycosyltransferase family 4 protein [Phycisphaerales bacterium]